MPTDARTSARNGAARVSVPFFYMAREGLPAAADAERFTAYSTVQHATDTG